MRGSIQRLEWQSWLVLAAVTPWCAWAAIEHATRPATAISCGLALLVLMARAATPMAALTGGIVTAVLTLAWPPWYHSALPALVSLFALTLAATRFGRSQKEQLGVAEEKHGREAAQVAANLGAAGLAAAFCLVHPAARAWCALAAVAALAEATADTVSSELGEVTGGTPVLITTFRRVAAGTDGAISMAGTLAGLAASVLLILVAQLTMKLDLATAGCAWLGSTAGLFVDSLLGATVERGGWLNNDAVNFLSTLAAVGIAFLLR